jgi:hypothetical protein
MNRPLHKQHINYISTNAEPKYREALTENKNGK